MSEPAAKPENAVLSLGRQPALSFMQCLQLCLRGMRYRIYRAGVTVAIVALAVAFLLHSMGISMLRQQIEWRAFQVVREHLATDEALTRLAAADAVAVILAHLADEGAEARHAEYQQWSHRPAADLARAAAAAATVARFQGYLAALPAHKSVALTGGLDAVSLLTRLQNPVMQSRFAQRLEALRLKEPLDGQAFSALIDVEYPFLMAVVKDIQDGQRRAVAAVAVAMGDGTPAVWLASRNSELQQAVAAAGFDLSLAEFAETARLRLIRQRLVDHLRDPRLLKKLRRRRDTDPEQLKPAAILAWLDSDSRSAWLAAELQQLELSPPPPPPEELLKIAAIDRELTRARAILGDRQPAPPAGLRGVPVRDRWLLLLAFMVCAVGIANAMMMSVTERFREISTMKCLGALDINIMLLFLLESAVVAMIGGLAGVAIGLFVTAARGILEFGSALAGGLVFVDLASAALLSVLAGVVLSVLAAVWPAITAARLAPMEAMRVE